MKEKELKARMVLVSLTHMRTQGGFMELRVDTFPNANEISFTFMHIHIDIGRVTIVNKNETITKIHPQNPRSVVGLSVKTKNTQVLAFLLARSPHEHLCLALYKMFHVNFHL